ncbi:hypothetical protein WOLCODRAFT_158865 [Wolfiporia cocos MD-104 SS10]|uniref:Uncharacterized protein n=1 Tax=Wolfiporia cocos (strain MD-104) TaxID=742152 RepID=A0A2H3JHJ6_WOLCO|nr:hypothetical protein WOLCODRAFT_158865 [Wolfiporia cocos MD-104 SS10]
MSQHGSNAPSPVHTPECIRTPVGVTPPGGETENVHTTLRQRNYLPDFLREPEEQVEAESEAMTLAARLAASQSGRPALPTPYGVYKLLRRRVPENVQWPSDAAIRKQLVEDVVGDLDALWDPLEIGWNAVNAATDIGTAYADLAVHTLRRQLDSRFKQMFQVSDLQNTYIRHLESRVQQLEMAAPTTTTSTVSQTAVDLLEARIKWLEKQPAATTSASAVTALEAKVKQLEAKLAALSASTVTTTAGQNITIRQPVDKPPQFSGKDKTGSITVKEWLQKLSMYFADTGIINEREQIIKALRTLTGVTFQYQEARINKARDPTQDLGTWKEFKDQMTNTYGKKSQEEIARKEIEKYFGDEGKKKAKADFFKYAGRLRVLQSHAKTDNKMMLEKLKDCLPEKVTDAFALIEVMAVGTIPTDWDKYLDKAIELYKVQYRSELTGSIFPEEKSATKALEAAKKTSNTHMTTTSQTSAPAKGTSGGDKKGAPPQPTAIPAEAHTGAYWHLDSRFNRWQLRAPPQKCKCGRQACTTRYKDCRSKPLTDEQKVKDAAY